MKSGWTGTGTGCHLKNPRFFPGKSPIFLDFFSGKSSASKWRMFQEDVPGSLITGG